MNKTLGWNAHFMNQLEFDKSDHLFPMRVIGMHRSRILVSDGAREDAIVLGGSWYRLRNKDRPTVGDWVLVNAARDKLEHVLIRKSCFSRLTSGNQNVQLIAANVDTLFVVTSCNDEFDESRLERYLVLAHEAEVTPVIVLTKADLTEAADTYHARAKKVANEVAIEVVNGLDRGTLDGVRAWISIGRTAALVGSSGVGKSTLLNSLSGATIQQTRAVRDGDSRGRHTTTSRSLHLLKEGGLLLDVPGMSELTLGDVSSGLRETFSDIGALAEKCRFADCVHASEPGCAVREALETGALDERRLNNYFKLLEAQSALRQNRSEKNKE